MGDFTEYRTEILPPFAVTCMDLFYPWEKKNDIVFHMDIVPRILYIKLRKKYNTPFTSVWGHITDDCSIE